MAGYVILPAEGFEIAFNPDHVAEIGRQQQVTTQDSDGRRTARVLECG